MAVAHTFMTSQRKFELTDFNTVVEKSGFNSTFSDRENRYENVISGNMQLGEALGITGTPGFIIMNMKSRMRRLPHLSPGLWTQQLCRAQSKSSRGLKLLSHLMSTAMPVMAATLLQRVIHPSGSYISVIAWPASYENPVECLPQ